MDSIDGMRTFVAVAETGSFSAAGRRLGLSNKLVSKYIAALEAQVGITLVFRTTRAMSVSPEGQVYLAGCRRVLQEIDALNASLDGTKGLRGTVRVAAPVTFGEVLVNEAALDFTALHPGVEIDLVLSDAYEDLAENGFDLAIRIGEMRDSNLRVRRLGEARIVTVAAPTYLAASGVPDRPSDLSDHVCIRDSNSDNPSMWTFSVDGRTTSVAVTGPLACNSASASLQAARLGVGIAMVPDLFAHREIASGDVQPVLEGCAGPPIPVQAVYLPSDYERPKLTALVAHMKGAVARSEERCRRTYAKKR